MAVNDHADHEGMLAMICMMSMMMIIMVASLMAFPVRMAWLIILTVHLGVAQNYKASTLERRGIFACRRQNLWTGVTRDKLECLHRMLELKLASWLKA